MRIIFLITFLGFFALACKDKEVASDELMSKPFVNIEQVVGVGRIEPENEIIQLASEVGGIVEKVYKNENDSVKKGEVILQLRHAVEDANIIQLQQAVALQYAQIKVEESSINESQIRYANASVELKRLKNLLSKGAETKQVVDDAETEMQSFNANIKKLNATVEVSKLKWKETKAEVAIAEAQLKQKFITSPLNGVLLELNVQTGNYIDSKLIFGQLNPEGKTIAVCEIDELFANKIKVGQSSIIRNFGSLDTLSTGKVFFVSTFLKKKSLFTDQSGEKEDRRVREIKISIDDPLSMLLNSRVECVVFLASVNN